MGRPHFLWPGLFPSAVALIKSIISDVWHSSRTNLPTRHPCQSPPHALHPSVARLWRSLERRARCWGKKRVKIQMKRWRRRIRFLDGSWLPLCACKCVVDGSGCASFPINMTVGCLMTIRAAQDGGCCDIGRGSG
jgi:hypothetical protein